MLAVGLLGGSIADVVDRRKLALVTSVCLMAVSAAFAVQAYPPAAVAAVRAGHGAGRAARGQCPGPAHVRAAAGAARELNAAITLNTLAGRVTMLFGPVLRA